MNEREIRFDGHDREGVLLCPRINVWQNYEERWPAGPAATVDHGAAGFLLGREGDKCRVRTECGAVGWVTFYFIREMKTDWMEVEPTMVTPPSAKALDACVKDKARKYFKLQNGQTLELQPVNLVTVSLLIEKLGGEAFLEDPTSVLALPPEERAEAETTHDRLMDYVYGWGVKDDAFDPVKDDGATDHRRIARRVRSILNDEREAMDLMFAVLKLSLEAESGS